MKYPTSHRGTKMKRKFYKVMRQAVWGTATPVSLSVPIPGKNLGKTARPKQDDSETSRVEPQSTVLPRAEDKRLIRKCVNVMKRMQSTTFLQKNASKAVKDGLMEVEEQMDSTSFGRQT